MNDGTTSTWNLILGSGPTSLDGTSTQRARLAVIPLHDRMNPSAGLMNLRIPAALPASSGSNEDFGTIYLSNSDGTPYENSYISDLITVDLETFFKYRADVVYFGTVSGDWDPTGWGGRLYRLVTRYNGTTAEFAGASTQVNTAPNEWPTLLNGLNQADGVTPLQNPGILYDAGKPILTAPTVGTDGRDFWVYFGTGRFFDTRDKTDDSSNATQTYYGIRETTECSGGAYLGLNWLTVTNATPPVIPSSSDTRGSIGLLPVEDIAIKLIDGALESTDGVVGCYDSNGDFDEVVDHCIGDPADTTELTGHPLEDNGNFGNLIDYIVGDYVYCSAGVGSPSPGFDGWSRDMPIYKERNLGQATLFGGLLSYSSYIPSTNVCNPEGKGYLYGLYYQTGTSWYKDVFGRTPIEEYEGEPIEPSVYLGEGLSTTPNIHVGEEEGGKAFIQTSVGKIVEIPQPNLPNPTVKSGRIRWRDID
jgi:type IV pilus assembly protein PilY1